MKKTYFNYSAIKNNTEAYNINVFIVYLLLYSYYLLNISKPLEKYIHTSKNLYLEFKTMFYNIILHINYIVFINTYSKHSEPK